MAMPEEQARKLADRMDKLLVQLDKEQARALVAELRQARKALTSRLKDLIRARLPAAQSSTSTAPVWEEWRTQQLLQEIDYLTADLAQRMTRVVAPYPERAAALADQYAASVLQVRVAGPFAVLNRPALVKLQQYNLELVKRVADDLRSQIRSAVMQGIIQGEDAAEISRRLVTGTALQRGTFAKVETRATVIARTETLRAFSQGVQWQFRHYGITRVQWMTARDERVCPWCGPLDGLIFPLEELPFGGPPIHPQCRCFIRPVIAATTDEGKVLDLDAARNVKEQRKRFEELQQKRNRKAG